MTFPTRGQGLVDPALIESLYSQMLEPLWRALYLAEIPDSDVALFRNLDRAFCRRLKLSARKDASYACGVDLGRRQDQTVVTVIDSQTGAVAATDRFHEISWTLQCERCAALYKRCRCSNEWVDATGVGDPVVEELGKLGVIVEPLVFTSQSRKTLLEKITGREFSATLRRWQRRERIGDRAI